MAERPFPVQLNKGLDLVSPPLLAEPGALIDCLNYELTDTSGYRRVDGYERYDGYPDGDIAEYYSLRLIATNPAEQALIIAGSVIQRTGVSTVDVGVVVGGPFSTDSYDVVAYGSVSNFLLEEDFVLLQDGVSNITLQTGDGLLKLQTVGELGATFYIKTPSGYPVLVTVGSTPVSGKSVAPDTITYLANLRVYSAVLRSLVTRAPGNIAGLYWFEDRLLAAVDAISMTVSVLATNPQPIEGVRVRWNGTIYRVIKVVLENADTINTYSFYLSPVGTSGTVANTLVQVDTAGTASTVWISDVALSGNVRTGANYYASLGYYNNTSTSLSRGFTYLPPASSFNFDGGTFAGGGQPSITLSDDSDPEDAYYAVGAGGATLKVRLTKLVQEDGSFTSGTAVGTAQVVVIGVIVGTRDFVRDGDVIHNAYPTTASSAVMTVDGATRLAVLAGSLKLDEAGTKYVWNVYNFYGQAGTLSAFGTTGASKAFWANEHGYGTIATGLSDELDKPKYVSFHANKLALGFSRGSVVLSVAGEPYNYNGFDGALEIATGDNITGLLEMAGSTLAVFGKRAIRKITGYTAADTVLGTVASGSSCFDYTAVMVGQEAVYTGLHGITTLRQSASYGDFVGERVSDAISTWLRPKLVSGVASVEKGGVAFAYPVRSKQQYRLVLQTGEIVVATFTKDGPRITFMNHKITGQPRVPYCWSSAVGVDGQERHHVAWSNEGLRNLAVAVDRGWGYDGQYFSHHFDTAHVFNENGYMNLGIERVRMYGMGYGVATLNIKSAGIEENFDQAYHDAVQDISMPPTPYVFYDRMQPVMSIIDQANWGVGIKLRIRNTTTEGSSEIEPSHICQVLILHLRTEGAKDS